MTEIAPVTIESLGAGTGQLIVPANSGSVNVYNGDPSNVLLVSPSTNPQISNSIPVQPLTSAPIISSRRAYYGAAESGQTIASVTVSAAQLSPSPLQIAQQFASSGVPLIRKPVNANYSSQLSASGVFGGASTDLVANYTVGQMGVEILLSLEAIQLATHPWVKLGFTWTDSISGLTQETENVILPVSYAESSDFIIEVPARLSELTLSIVNLDANVTAFYAYTVNQSSRPINALRVAELSLAQMSAGFNRPGGDPLKGVLSSSAESINAGQNGSRLAAVWFGPATLTIDNDTANAVKVTLNDPQSLYSTSGTGALAGLAVAANETSSIIVDLPAGPVLVTTFNQGGSGTVSPTVSLVRKETGA